MKKISIVLLSIIAAFLIISPVYATSSAFLTKANQFINKTCSKNYISKQDSLSCYLFYKIGELETEISNLQQNDQTGFVPDRIIDVCFHVDTAALTVMKSGTCFPHVHWRIPVQCVSGKPCQPDNPNDSFFDPPL